MKRSIKPKSKFYEYDVSVVIVCRNGKDVTQTCLLGISKLSVRQIIVVDNQSSDGTAQILDKFTKKDKRFEVVRNKTNNGFAKANNQGFSLAIGKYVLFLNNDTVIIQDFLPKLLKTLRATQVAAVQPMILFPDGTIDSIGSYFTPTGFLYHRAHRMKPELSFLKEEPVYSMKGACMLWKRAVLEKIGVFDESYFAYFEETELCHRAINAGYQVMVNPDCTVVHLGGFTSNSMNQSIIQYYNTKNRIFTYLRHLSLNKLLPVILFQLLISQALVIKTLLGLSFWVGVKIQKGIIDGFFQGIINRGHSSLSPKSLTYVTKIPDYSYYIALFSSLVGFTKVW